MADIQAEGLRAARELLDRVLQSEAAAETAAEAPGGDYSTFIHAWTDLAQRTLAAMSASGPPGTVTVLVDTVDIGPPVRLNSQDPVEVWLHNGTGAPAGPFALRCGPLQRADGVALEGAEVRFEPPAIESLPARSSRAVVVSLAGAAAPGVYRGVLQAEGAAGLWLPFEVTVG